MPIRFRQRLDLAEHGAWLLRVTVLFTRVKDHNLRLVMLEWQLNLGPCGGFLDHTQGANFARPWIPELHRSLGAELDHVTGLGIHGEVDITRADLAVQGAYRAVQAADIVDKGGLDFFQRFTGTNEAVGLGNGLG